MGCTNIKLWCQVESCKISSCGAENGPWAASLRSLHFSHYCLKGPNIVTVRPNTERLAMLLCLNKFLRCFSLWQNTQLITDDRSNISPLRSTLVNECECLQILSFQLTLIETKKEARYTDLTACIFCREGTRHLPQGKRRSQLQWEEPSTRSKHIPKRHSNLKGKSTQRFS